MTDWVYKTAWYSTVAQVCLGAISFVGFANVPQDERGRMLWVLLILDVVVQFVELIFYVYFVCVHRLETWYRYIDWFVTTPIMLVSIMAFLDYMTDSETTLARFASTYSDDVVFVVVMNFIMLMFGLSYERRWIPGSIALPLGWIAFLSTFASIYSRIAYKAPASIGLLGFVFVVWSGYGVAACFTYVPKNVTYNVLDIAAKNFYGIVVAFSVLAIE